MSSDNEDNSLPEPVNRQFPECGTRGLHVLFEPEFPQLDIIFLHGLNGDSYYTWLHKKSKVYWPRDILPNDLRKARIITYGYDADVARLLEPASQTNLRIEADRLFRTLTNKRSIDGTSDRHVIWVAYSLGGIVLKKALHLSTQDTDDFRIQLHRRTFGILFLGTPHKGSKLASPASALAKGARVFTRANINLLDALKRNSVLLDEYHHTFLVWLRERKEQGNELMLINYYEMLEYKGAGLIVRQESATMDDYPAQPIDANHENMARFESRYNSNYQSVKDEILSWIGNLSARMRRQQMIDQNVYEDCIERLGFPEMDHRYFDVDPNAEGTCQWVIGHNQYKKWIKDHKSLLWISGNPGAGKSTILKYLINYFKKKFKYALQDKSIVILSFLFHGRGSELQKSTIGMFRSLLCQLLKQTASPLLALVEAVNGKHPSQGEVEWRLNEVKYLFEESLATVLKSQTVFIFMDALDECGEDVAVTISEDLQNLIKRDWRSDSKLKICFSCRHFPLLDVESYSKIVVEKENSKDILSYVNDQLCNEGWQSVASKIADRANGLFIWAVLVTRQVKNLIRKGRMKEARSEPDRTPMGLYELYSQLLQAIEEEKKAFSLKCFKLAYFAFKPLPVEHFEFVVRLDLDDSQKLVDFVEEMNSPEKILTDLSCGLLEVPENQSIVQFVHESVKDFLIEKGFRMLDGFLNTKSLVVCRGHEYILRCCIHILLLCSTPSIDLVQKERRDFFTAIQRHASEFWIKHTLNVEAEIEIDESLTNRLKWPSDIFSKFGSRADDHEVIHEASQNGVIRLVRFLILNEQSSLNARDRYYMTPLMLASRSGHIAITRYLLESGANARLMDEKRNRALHYAAGSGCKDLLRLILDYDTDVNSPNKNYDTPIFRAVQYKCEASIKVLLSYNAEVNYVNIRGETPLFETEWHTDETIARLLLDNGAMVNVCGDSGITPLLAAARSGRLKNLTLFLRRGANIESRDGFYGRTALSWAVIYKNKDVVGLLLDWDADIESRDNEGRTPLSWATTGCENEDVVGLFLDWGADIESRDNEGRTPLSWASGIGRRNHEIVRLLLSRGSQVDSLDNNKRTPLSWASSSRFNGDKLVKPLLQWGAQVDSRDNDGRTPLSRAAELYDDEINKRPARLQVLRILIEDGGAMIDSQDEKGQTPLMWAVKAGADDVISLLIQLGAAVDLRNKKGQTALLIALVEGSCEAASKLLDFHADIYVKDNDGESPLSWALRHFVDPDIISIDYMHFELWSTHILCNKIMSVDNKKTNNTSKGSCVVLAQE